MRKHLSSRWKIAKVRIRHTTWLTGESVRLCLCFTETRPLCRKSFISIGVKEYIDIITKRVLDRMEKRLQEKIEIKTNATNSEKQQRRTDRCIEFVSMKIAV